MGSRFYAKCKTCKKREEQEEIEKEISERLSCIPLRFQKSTFDSYIPKNEKQRRALFAMTGNPAGSFMLIGDYGAGKTHLLYAQYRVLAPDQNSIIHVASMHQLLDVLQKRALGNSVGEWLVFFSALDGREEGIHLFLDDADKFKVTDFKLEMLFDLIDTLYRQNCKLTITANMGLLELQEKLSPAICRRIDDICTKVEL